MVNSDENNNKSSKLEEKTFAFSIYGWYLLPIVGLVLYFAAGMLAIPIGIFYLLILFTASIKSHSDNDISYSKSFLYALIWISVIIIIGIFVS